MKPFITIALLMFACSNIYGQMSEKFNYELNKYGTSYLIKLKSEQPAPENSRVARAHFDTQLATKTLISIVEQSIPSKKLQKLIEVNGVVIQLAFSVTGKILRITVSIPKEYIHILNEDELYTLFSKLQKFEICIIDIEYSRNWVQEWEPYCVWLYPLRNLSNWKKQHIL